MATLMMASGKTESSTVTEFGKVCKETATSDNGTKTKHMGTANTNGQTAIATKANGSKIYAGAGESKFSPMGIYTKVNGRTMPWMAVVDTRMRITATSRESFRKVCKCPANTHLQTDL